MPRAEKIAILSKLLEQGANQNSLQQIQKLIEQRPRSLIIIDDLGDTNCPLSESSPVHFFDQGKEHRMSWQDARQYARRFSVQTLFVLPDNKRSSSV